MSEINTNIAMTLQEFLVEKFSTWSPTAPEVLDRTKCSITLHWGQIQPFEFIADKLLYRLEKNDKIPPWFVIYRGGMTNKEIINLAPRHPHKFRLKVIIQANAVPTLADRAIQFYGNEANVYEEIVKTPKKMKGNNEDEKEIKNGKKDGTDVPNITVTDSEQEINHRGSGDQEETITQRPSSGKSKKSSERAWLESQWSEQTWTSTDTDGTSSKCFCMAVRCGYVKQVQSMLEERPELIGVLNPANGFTPLATAVRKGDLNTVRFLLGAGAEIDQHSLTGQTALHLAVLNAQLPIADLLLEKGADFLARDLNGLRVEHYAVDSGNVEVMRYVLEKGGDVKAEDNNGWTPLFRALCQSASTGIIEELVIHGSDLALADKAGLPLTSVARILTNRQGRNRDSVLRLVDMNYPHEMALANFTRLTKKIYNVHTLLKLPSLTKKPNLRK